MASKVGLAMTSVTVVARRFEYLTELQSLPPGAYLLGGNPNALNKAGSRKTVIASDSCSASARGRDVYGMGAQNVVGTAAVLGNSGLCVRRPNHPNDPRPARSS
jgi:hypothetical protein